MKLEQQVVSLELAKKLKELGVKQESLFYWADCCGSSLVAADWHDQEMGEWGDCHTYESKPHYAAFTVAELGEILVQKQGQQYLASPTVYAHYVNDADIQNDTEADARAKMLIHLLENGLLKS